MYSGKLKQVLNRFSIEELSKFVGKDLIDALIEWTNENYLSNKTNYIQLLETIDGYAIFKNKEFIKLLLSKLDKDDLNDIFKLKEDAYNYNKIISKYKYDKSSSELKRILNRFDIDLEEVYDFNEESYVSNEKVIPNGRFYELLDYQFIIKQQALTYLYSDMYLQRLLIHMPTGTGKTKTACHIITNFINLEIKNNGLVLWIADTKELLDQAYETFVHTWKYIGYESINIYRCYDNYEIENLDITNGFMILGLKKLMSIKALNKNLYDLLKENVRLIIFDEAHKIIASQTKSIISDMMRKPAGFHNRALVGLTATPGRTTSFGRENLNLAEFFDNNIISIDIKKINHICLQDQKYLNTDNDLNIIKYFQDRKVLSKIKKEVLEYDRVATEEELIELQKQMKQNRYDDFSKKILEKISVNKKRNQKILEKLFLLYNQKIPTIVFACTVEHAKLLGAMLSSKNIENGVITGELSSIERRKIISRFKNEEDNLNILINYGVLTTGFDATNIGCVFITRPTKSIVLYSQMIGRGLRGPMMGGNEYCLLIDLDDNLNTFDEYSAFTHFKNYWEG